MQALSVTSHGGKDGPDAKIWDLETKEFINVLKPTSHDEILDIYVNWARMEAMAVMDTQVELWDLDEPENNPLSVKVLPTRIIKAATISPSQEHQESVRPPATPSEPEPEAVVAQAEEDIAKE